MARREWEGARYFGLRRSRAAFTLDQLLLTSR
jgi:hypothetical protein